MSMTLEEARIELQAMKDTFEEYEPGGSRGQMALKVALSALRPVSREQVEKVWGGCEWCDEEWGTCNPITNRFTMPPRGGIRFCPMCGKPLTDEAVEMVMERINKMEGMENEPC